MQLKVMEGRVFIATYMLPSRPFGVLYIGMTGNLYERGRQHREGLVEAFSKQHRCGLLVLYEGFERITSAIRREKTLKRWNRAWKMQLIERRNPNCADLYPSLCGWAPDPRVEPEDDGEGSVTAFLASLAARSDD